MIEYVFFDVGGVLSTDTESYIIREISATLDLGEEITKDAFKRNSKDLQRGKISEHEFWQKFLVFTGSNSRVTPVVNLCEIYAKNSIPLNHNLLIASQLRKRGYGTGIITNTITPIYEYNEGRGLFQGFEPVIASCQEGVIKPEREIYELAFRRANQDPKNCVFIDDKETFLKPASDLGMIPILHSSPSELEKKLTTLGLL